MNATSLEISKKLYEVSGWDNCSLKWIRDKHPEHNMGEFVSDTNVTPKSMEYLAPAYDLGYLLRKLPGTIGNKYLDIGYGGTGVWSACYELFEQDHYCTADTSEDATALLAIKLIEEGIIK